MRYTVNELKGDLAEYNRRMNDKGLNRFMEWCGRNDYQAVYMYATKECGDPRVLYNLACGSSREVSKYAQVEAYQLINNTSPERLTRHQAKALLEENGLNFEQPFDQKDVPRLRLFARLSKYRTSNRDVTLEWMFFHNLKQLK